MSGVLSCVFLIFFFFKQKTAYEMRISDWSSDVCSSDLETLARLGGDVEENEATLAQAREEQAGLPDLNLAHQRADELREEVTAARSALVERQARLDQLRREAEARRRRLADIETERSEEHTSELQSLMRIPYAVFCLK